MVQNGSQILNSEYFKGDGVLQNQSIPLSPLHTLNNVYAIYILVLRIKGVCEKSTIVLPITACQA